MEILGWYSFNNRRDYFTATLMFKCINGLAPLCLINELNVTGDAHSANTWASSNGNTLVPIPHVKKIQEFFQILRCCLMDIHEAQSIDEFKYKKHYLTKRDKNITRIQYSMLISWFYDITMVISTAFLTLCYTHLAMCNICYILFDVWIGEWLQRKLRSLGILFILAKRGSDIIALK